MSDIKAKMHKIRFLLGLRPRPRWVGCSAFPDPLAVCKGLLLRRGKGKERGGEDNVKDRGEAVEGGILAWCATVSLCRTSS